MDAEEGADERERLRRQVEEAACERAQLAAALERGRVEREREREREAEKMREGEKERESLSGEMSKLRARLAEQECMLRQRERELEVLSLLALLVQGYKYWRRSAMQARTRGVAAAAAGKQPY